MTLLTLACLLLVVAVAAQRPVLKYGLTLSQCGVSASISMGQKQTLEWYANYTNAHGGVNISGLIHDVEFVMYGSLTLTLVVNLTSAAITMPSTSTSWRCAGSL